MPSARPVVLREVAEVRRWVKSGSGALGLVPTMGALHAGHAALLRAARGECERVVASLFVNPLQFGPGEDLKRYPRDPQADHRVLEEAGVDAVFWPEAAEMYPQPPLTTVDLPALASRWEGASRPGHFAGVALAVTKLLSIVRPQRAYFGEKDYQQLVVVRRLVEDLNLGAEVRAVPVVREASGELAGLALSSRNRFLEGPSRSAATGLSRGLAQAAAAFEGGGREVDHLTGLVRQALQHPDVKPDYVAVVDPLSLEPREGEAKAGDVLVVAARVGAVRLIDNHVLGRPATWPLPA